MYCQWSSTPLGAQRKYSENESRRVSLTDVMGMISDFAAMADELSHFTVKAWPTKASFTAGDEPTIIAQMTKVSRNASPWPTEAEARQYPDVALMLDVEKERNRRNAQIALDRLDADIAVQAQGGGCS